MIEWMRRDPVRARMVLLVAPVLVLLWTYFGSASFYSATIAGADRHGDLYAYIYHHAGCFVILGIGSIMCGMVLGWSPGELGWGKGNWKMGLFIMAVCLPFVVPVTYVSSFQQAFIREYPVADGALRNMCTFFLHVVAYLLYYLGWEAFFRGFLLFGLEEECGPWMAILIQSLPSTLLHTSIVIPGKPFMETLGALPFGIFAGWLSLRTRSFWYAFFIHAVLGIGLDVWFFI